MKERGNAFTRKLDRWIGIPLVSAAGAGSRLARGNRTPPDLPRSIGILCFAAIGDLLLTSTLCNALRSQFPEAAIRLYATKANAGALSVFPPEYSRRVFSMTDFKGIIRSLEKDAFDILFDTTQWARIGAIFSLFSKARFTVGFDTPGQFRSGAYDAAVPHRAALHETENFLNLARAVAPRAEGAPSIVLPDAPSVTLPDLPPETLPRVIFMHMWASGRNPAVKEWSPEAWAALALRCRAAGYRVAFTGGPGDAEKTDAFLARCIPPEARESRDIVSVAGKTDLADLAWMFSRSAAVVSVNTGIAHLAGLSGAATLDLHGPTTPGRWGARGPHVHHVTAPGESGGYLYLGFEFPAGAVPPLHALTPSSVQDALRRAGVRI